MDWHQTVNIASVTDDEVVMEVKTRKDSPWFSGHFEGNPILPGIAQLKMVADAVRAFGNSSDCVMGVRKVRFKKMIRPEEPVTIQLKRRDAPHGDYSFRITVHGELACKGLMVTC